MKKLMLCILALTIVHQAAAVEGEQMLAEQTAHIKERMLADSGGLYVRESAPSNTKIRLAQLLATSQTGRFECYEGRSSGSITEFLCVMPVTRGTQTRYLNLRGEYIHSRLGDGGYGVSIDEDSLVLAIGG